MKLSSGQTLNPNLALKAAPAVPVWKLLLPNTNGGRDAHCVNMQTFLSPLKRNSRLIAADLARTHVSSVPPAAGIKQVSSGHAR